MRIRFSGLCLSIPNQIRIIQFSRTYCNFSTSLFFPFFCLKKKKKSKNKGRKRKPKLQHQTQKMGEQHSKHPKKPTSTVQKDPKITGYGPKIWSGPYESWLCGQEEGHPTWGFDVAK